MKPTSVSQIFRFLDVGERFSSALRSVSVRFFPGFGGTWGLGALLDFGALGVLGGVGGKDSLFSFSRTTFFLDLISGVCFCGGLSINGYTAF